MTITVKDASGTNRTVMSLDDITKGSGAVDSATLRTASATDDLVVTQVGATNETAPASDTAASGLNGRLQRIAQRLTALINLLPTSLGANGGLKIEGVASGVAVPVSAASLPLPTGASTAAAQATSNTALAAIQKSIAGEYETVAASQTDQAIGATGAAGDYISHVLVVPATTAPGAVSIKDGSGTAITIFAGGTGSVTCLVPFAIPLGMLSLTGAWKITTGANVSVIAVGDFT